MTKQRCAWANTDPLLCAYHDKEWGKPLRNDEALFELLMLECMQAGLSWLIILRKRDNYRASFDQFDPEKIARYKTDKITQLMKNPGIIRHKLKISAIIENAKAYLRIKQESGSFSKYLWQFVNHTPINYRRKTLRSIPSRNSISDNLSKDLKKRGFKFTGSTICYAFMQAAGMINDHTLTCFRQTSRS